MNEQAEGFRRATMRLLRMQLNSITIMDLFAFGGAAVGIVMVLGEYAAGAVAFGTAFSIVFLSRSSSCRCARWARSSTPR